MPNKPTPMHSFNRRHAAGRFAVIAILIVVVINATVSWHLSNQIGRKPQVIAMDGTAYYVPLSLDFRDAKRLHWDQAALAMESLFDRGPSGLDHGERLNRLFLRDASSKARALVETEKAAFEAKKLHQKFELSSIELLTVADDGVLAAVEGQLIRTGMFAGESFTEGLIVKARLQFLRNPSMVTNGAFPTVVKDFQFETTPVVSE